MMRGHTLRMAQILLRRMAQLLPAGPPPMMTTTLLLLMGPRLSGILNIRPLLVLLPTEFQKNQLHCSGQQRKLQFDIENRSKDSFVRNVPGEHLPKDEPDAVGIRNPGLIFCQPDMQVPEPGIGQNDDGNSGQYRRDDRVRIKKCVNCRNIRW